MKINWENEVRSQASSNQKIWPVFLHRETLRGKNKAWEVGSRTSTLADWCLPHALIVWYSDVRARIYVPRSGNVTIVHACTLTSSERSWRSPAGQLRTCISPATYASVLSLAPGGPRAYMHGWQLSTCLGSVASSSSVLSRLCKFLCCCCVGTTFKYTTYVQRPYIMYVRVSPI